VKASPGQRALRLGIRALQAAAPPLAGWVAERLFFTPPRRPATPDVRALLERGRSFAVRVEGRRVVGWAWGEGPAIVLVHGWGSRGARLGAFVEPLVALGRRVVTFDGPGHGASEGRMSSMIELARALRAVAEEQGPFDAAIAHSLGAAATTLALTSGLTLRAAAFLAPAADPAAWTVAFARALGFNQNSIDRMKRRSERRLRFRWDGLHVADLARAQSARLLVLHDREDETIPWRDGQAIASAWPGAKLVTTQGLGHRDIARDAEVVRRATSFVTEPA
jgi:pimeloyl-ACP methyl ester carboxylesterase